MDLDKEIEVLEKQLQKLKELKELSSNIELFNYEAKVTGLVIKLYSDDRYVPVKEFTNFKQLFDFLEKKKKQSDKIGLDYRKNGCWYNEDFYFDEDSKKHLLELIGSFDAHQIYSMDFTLCNKKDVWIYEIVIETPFLKRYSQVIQREIPLTEEEYWKTMDEGKKFKLFNKESQYENQK